MCAHVQTASMARTCVYVCRPMAGACACISLHVASVHIGYLHSCFLGYMSRKLKHLAQKLLFIFPLKIKNNVDFFDEMHSFIDIYQGLLKSFVRIDQQF